jgi:hypothetical protein
VKEYLQPKREESRTAAVRRFETPPGRQAQVDWAHLGTLAIDGEEYRLSGFTFTLGYSRMMMAEAALDQKLGTLLRMHEEAFRQLGGVPEEILYDRMKTAIRHKANCCLRGAAPKLSGALLCVPSKGPMRNEANFCTPLRPGRKARRTAGCADLSRVRSIGYSRICLDTLPTTGEGIRLMRTCASSRLTRMSTLPVPARPSSASIVSLLCS